MSELDHIIERLEDIRSTYDVEEMEAKVDEVVKDLKGMDQRSHDAEKALTLVTIAGVLIPDNLPTLHISPETRDRLAEEGCLVADVVRGDVDYELSVEGDAFIRRTTLDLVKANRFTVEVES